MNPIAEMILNSEIKNGDRIKVVEEDGKIKILPQRIIKPVSKISFKA